MNQTLCSTKRRHWQTVFSCDRHKKAGLNPALMFSVLSFAAAHNELMPTPSRNHSSSVKKCYEEHWSISQWLAVYDCVEMVRIRDRWDGKISVGDGGPSARCGNVAVVALCLLANRKMCFYCVWCAGSLKGLKPEIVWRPSKLIPNDWTRELTSNPPECFPSVDEIAVVYPASHQRSEKQYLTIPVK